MGKKSNDNESYEDLLDIEAEDIQLEGFDVECNHDYIGEVSFQQNAVHKFMNVAVIQRPTTAMFECKQCGESIPLFVIGGCFGLPDIK